MKGTEFFDSYSIAIWEGSLNLTIYSFGGSLGVGICSSVISKYYT